MHTSKTLKPVAIAALSMVLAAPMAQAQTAQIFIENAKTWGGGNTINMYGVPVKNAVDGKASYWDLQIQLDAATDSTGKPNKATLTSVVKSPSIKKSDFVPGTYIAGSWTCGLTMSPFAGRIEYKLDCAYSNYHNVYLWYSGPIAGHPYEADLTAAGLDKIVGSDEYSWGKVTNENYSNLLCSYVGDLISARQVGNNLTLINWGSNSTEDCRQGFDKQL